MDTVRNCTALLFSQLYFQSSLYLPTMTSAALKKQASAMEDQLAGINEDILALSDDIRTQMQLEILNGDMERTEDELAVAKEMRSGSMRI